MLLLLLSACAAVGFSYDYKETYGGSHSIRLAHDAQTLEFLPQSDPHQGGGGEVLWRRGDAQAGGRGAVVGASYRIRHLTQRDSGTYLVRDADQRVLLRQQLEVRARTLKLFRRSGGSLFVSSFLSGGNCNVFFTSRQTNETRLVVSRGHLRGAFCPGQDFEGPCMVFCGGLGQDSNGRLEFKDQGGGTELMVELEVESLFYEKPYFGASIAALVLSVLGGCVKICCCKKKKKKSEGEDEAAADEEPAVFYHEYDQEPVGPRRESNQQPSAPLIHGPPPTAPSSYSESPSAPAGPDLVPQSSGPLVPPSAEPPSYSQVLGDPLSFPLTSGPDLRFEVRGAATFDPSASLTSDSESAVYTSDKLNFL